ncbi:uncharacterized protein A1O5_01073 [Cladophialophora psammophila CBS 110553]|uniref:Uncharacterized protein n=1 Tax=Cladophialophora psammophila CBS 110553 TaxID=1182543 RepID=W9XGU9_9EURO|nr:uncharacterized protein A1O5_01073 [Cladophialophora psammophila CBS 110553]EXJ76565.1 hypothetical protein A1O5_01073 [Cladophialophora psammophila CBS 110553]
MACTVLQDLDRQGVLSPPDQLQNGGTPLRLFVTGKALVSGLKDLESKAGSASEQQRQHAFGRINSEVDVALHILRLFAEATSTARDAEDHDLQQLLRAVLPGEIELSIVLLAETIKHKLVDIYGSRLSLRPLGGQWLLEKMQDLGWYQAFLSYLLHRYGMRFIYYGYLQGSIPDHGLDHSKCQGIRCVANNIDKATYVT